MIRAVPKPPKREKRPRSRLVRKPKKRNRSASEFRRIYGSRARVAWVKAQSCVTGRPYCVGINNIENAHVVDDGSKGMGRKSGYATIVPLCRLHHADLHAFGRFAFEATYKIDLAAAAADTERRWLASQETKK